MISTRPARDNRSDERAETAYYVLGEGDIGGTVADHLRAEGHAVTLVDVFREPADSSDVRGDLTAVEVLDEAGLEAAPTVIVATRSDRRNLLVAQLARVRLDALRVLVLVNSPSRIHPFAEAGHEPICTTTALSKALVDGV